MDAPVISKFFPLQDPQGNPSEQKIASLCINRPKSANAFSGEILVAIKNELKKIAEDGSVRLLLFQSIGKHFSAGADLGWMKESAKMGYEHNFSEAQKLTDMFEQLSNMPMPTIAVVKGAAYGGAVGIVACCDSAVALDNAQFCLSEARVGLIPAVILPYLSRKMQQGQLRRYTLSAKVFGAQEALDCGLVQAVESHETVSEWIIKEAQRILSASPEAQLAYKNLHQVVLSNSNEQSEATCEAIAKIRATPMGQEGLASFFEKRKPSWSLEVQTGSSIFEDVK